MGGKNKEKNTGSARVLCIGLDGATFDLISPFIEQGRLPNLKRLMEEGSHSSLTSVIPPLSPQAWSSFMTGVNPGKHGLFGFKCQKKNGYEFRFTNNSDIKAKTLWKLVGERGKKVIMVNVPFTYPPEEVNGLMISGLGTPGTGVDFTFPAYLKQEVLRVANDYSIHLHVWGSLDSSHKREKALDALLKMTEKRAALCRHLMNRYPWDLFVVVFTSIDQVQHHFWKYLEGEGNDKVSKFHDAILRVYEKNDEAIGLLLENIDENTTVLTMSDHGAGRFSGIKIHIDEVLRRENLLFLESDEKQPLPSFLVGLRLRVLYLVHRARKRLIKSLSSKTKDAILKFLPTIREKVATVGRSAIDWKRTRVYPGENVDFLRVNLKGRLPEGSVEAGQAYEDLLDSCIGKLEHLRHPDTGERLIEKVFRKEDLYHGPYLDEAPDLIIWTKDYEHVIRGDVAQDKQRDIISLASDESDPSGTHRLNGILIVTGKHIKAGAQIPSAHIMDVFPTILYLMGCPIPEYVDGTLLTEIFSEGCVEANPVCYVELEMDRMISMTEKDIYSEQEKEQIARHLADLGYFE